MLSLLGEIYDQFKEAIALGVVGSVGYMLNRLKKERQNYECLNEGVKALLQDRLFQTCNHYIFTQGFMEMKDLNNIENLYKNYKNLGGNGVGTELYERCKQLDLVDAEVAAELLEKKNIDRVAKNLEALREQESREQAEKSKLK